ncbi:MAG: hypothetical protein EOM11_10830 [Erysipelotrichia bacterium]|nr:hypothetical protein [Erysipelotrichia bacterium]
MSERYNFDVILLIEFDEVDIHFLFIYVCFFVDAIFAKSLFQININESFLVPSSLVTENVLIQLIPAFSNVIDNFPLALEQECISILVSELVQEVTPAHLTGKDKVVVVVSA